MYRVIAAVTLAPLAWWPWCNEPYAMPKMAVLMACGIACLPDLRMTGRLTAPIVALLVACFAASGTSIEPHMSMTGWPNSYTYGLYGCMAYAVLHHAVLALRFDEAEVLKSWMVATAAAIAVLAVVQRCGFLVPDRMPPGRATSALGSPVHLGAYLALLLPLAWQYSKAAFVAMLAGLLASDAKGAWLGAGISALLYVPVLLRAPDARLRAIWALAATLTLAAVWWVFQSGSQSDIGRVEGWKVAWRAFLNRPWLGSGPDTYGIVFWLNRTPRYLEAFGTTPYHAEAHNLLMQLLSTTGAIGTAAALWLLGVLGRRAWQYRDKEAAIVAGLASLLVGWQFNSPPPEVVSVAAVMAGILARNAA